MTERVVRGVTAAALLAACSAAMGAGAAGGPIPAEAEVLLRAYPGSRLAFEGDRVRAIYGVPMTPGRTPAQAASLWLAQHGEAFGAGDLELEEQWSTTVRDGRFTVFGYSQTIDGIPVELGVARVLVLNGPVNRVVYAAGRLAPRPAEGFRAVRIDGETALAIVQAHDEYAHLPSWSDPQLVIWQGDDEWRAPVRVWKVTGRHPDIARQEVLTFFVDAATGELVHVRDEILHVDVIGTIHGMGSPSDLPDIGTNPPALLPLPEIRINIVGGNNAFSDREGNFTIPHGGTSNVTVTTNVSSGRWVNVNPQTSAELTLSQTVTPGVPAALVLNTAPSQLTTAQINAFIHTNVVHNFFRDRAPGFTAIDRPIAANTAVSGTCNAFYDPSVDTINFFNAGGGCVNTAYSTVVHHEYGHFIVNELGLGQGAFGEGFGDTMGLLIVDAPGIGRAWTGNPNTYLRNVETANMQYPCSSSGHTCGQVLGGVWRDMRLALGATHGSQAGLDMARDMAVAWALITMGGSGTNSAHPTTAVEVLTIDDDDGVLANGTPNYTDICAAFGDHGIDCPPLELLTFDYPDGLPTMTSPSGPTTFRVNVVADHGQPEPGTGWIFYRTGGSGLFTGFPMTELAPNQYEASLPTRPCGSVYEFYVTALSTTGIEQRDPADAPDSVHVAISAASGLIVVDDAMETNTGWTVGAPGDTATTGIWNRMDPQPTAAQPGDDHTPDPGVMCWVTDGRAGTSLGSFDVDGGATTLTSPTIDVSGWEDALVSYWRWYSNNTGDSPGADVFTVDVSNDGGATWTRVETVGPTGPGTTGGWFQHQFTLGNFVEPTANVRLRFVASDLGSGSIVEAAIDDLRVNGFNCTAACPADFDGDGDLTPADFAAFRAAFLAGDNAADFDGDGDLTPADFSDFRNAFLAGCP